MSGYISYSTNCSYGSFHHVGFTQKRWDKIYLDEWERYAEDDEPEPDEDETEETEDDE